MKTERVGYPIPFGIYKVEQTTHYGKCLRGQGKNYKLDIYSGYEDGKLAHKLYYLSDTLGNWIKSKLVYFTKEGKRDKILYGNSTK